MAARLRGERAGFVMAREILPNITQPVIVEGTVRLGYAVFTAATLSFLGFGVQPPSPDWGLTIAQQRGSSLQVARWAVTSSRPMALASLVVGVNLIADGLRKDAAPNERPRRMRSAGDPATQPALDVRSTSRSPSCAAAGELPVREGRLACASSTGPGLRAGGRVGLRQDDAWRMAAACATSPLNGTLDNGSASLVDGQDVLHSER